MHRAGGGDEIRAFSANVVGRSAEGFCGGFEAKDEKGEAEVEEVEGAKGLLAAAAFEVLEKGFGLEILVENVELKRLLPRDGGSCSSSAFFLDSELLLFDVLVFPEASFETLIPRIALTVPSFFRQALRLQLNI